MIIVVRLPTQISCNYTNICNNKVEYVKLDREEEVG